MRQLKKSEVDDYYFMWEVKQYEMYSLNYREINVRMTGHKKGVCLVSFLQKELFTKIY